MAKNYRKHIVVFNNGGVISATTPKDWARAHQDLFNDYDFSNSDNTPVTDLIEKELKNRGFKSVDNNEIVIYYEFNSI
jgi:hypothetical protein